MEAIGLLIAAPIFGYLSDAIANRRGPMLGGMFVMAGASVMLCLAKTLPLLVVGRLLQGASAGVVWVVGLALLAETVGQKRVGQFMGYTALSNSIAALLAPLLGGIVYEKAGYYAVFGMGFGMIGLDLVFRLSLIEKKDASKWIPQRGREPAEASQKEKPQHATPQFPPVLTRAWTTVSSHSSTPDSTSAILNRESKHHNPKKLPPFIILLKSRRMQAAFLANTMDAMILTAFDVTLPLFVEDTFGWNALGAGLAFLALLSPCFVQPLFGMLIARHGAKPAAVLGLLLCIPPWAYLRLITYDSMSQKVSLVALSSDASADYLSDTHVLFAISYWPWSSPHTRSNNDRIHMHRLREGG